MYVPFEDTASASETCRENGLQNFSRVCKICRVKGAFHLVMVRCCRLPQGGFSSLCTTNKRPGSRLLHGGERIYVLERVKGGAPLPLSQAPALLQVVYEDDELACIIKPPGMPMEVSLDQHVPSRDVLIIPVCLSTVGRACVCLIVIKVRGVTSANV